MNIENVLLVFATCTAAWAWWNRPIMQSNKTFMNNAAKKDLLYKAQQ